LKDLRREDSAPPGTSPSYGSARNLTQLIHLLHISPLGIGLEELLERLGITERTWLRYLHMLGDTLLDEEGEPLVEVVRYTGGRRVRFRRKPVVIQGQAYQLMSLFMAMELMSYLEGTVFHRGALEVLEHFGRSVSRSHGLQTNLMMKDFQRKFLHVSDAPKSYGQQAAILERLVEALILQRWISLEYRAPNKPAKVHRLAPLSLLLFRRGLYLLGRRHLAEGEATFAVERIREVSLEKEGFSYPADYEPRSRFQEQFGLIGGQSPQLVRLCFDPQLEELVRARLWHPSQEFSTTPAGLEMRLKVGISEELIAFLLSFGPQLKVLEPKELKHEVIERLRRALAEYES
jgi:proteasome accessory factor B